MSPAGFVPRVGALPVGCQDRRQAGVVDRGDVVVIAESDDGRRRRWFNGVLAEPGEVACLWQPMKQLELLAPTVASAMPQPARGDAAERAAQRAGDVDRSYGQRCPGSREVKWSGHLWRREASAMSDAFTVNSDVTPGRRSRGSPRSTRQSSGGLSIPPPGYANRDQQSKARATAVTTSR